MPLSPTEQTIVRAVQARKAALLQDLERLVAIPTGLNHRPGLDETRAILAGRAAALGARVDMVPGDPRPAWLDAGREGDAAAPAGGIPPTAVCRRLGGPGHPVLIAGHLDTVHDPAGPFRELSIAPGGATATGPGVVDMKGGLVIAIHALEVLDEVGVDVPWTFLLNSDEETGSFHSDAALRAEAGRRNPDGRPAYAAGLALEPAMAKGELAIRRGGSGQFMLEAHGKAAHVGRDFAGGASAVDALARGIVAAHALSRPAEGLCVNVGPLECRTPPNMVAPHARAWGNVRFPGPEAGTALAQDLEKLSGAIPAGPSRLPRLEIHVRLNRPAKPTTPQVEALAALARQASEDLGRPLPYGQTAGVCDGNNLQDMGLATIDTLGVRGGGLHTPEEWIELASLVDRCGLLAVVVNRIGLSGLG